MAGITGIRRVSARNHLHGAESRGASNSVRQLFATTILLYGLAVVFIGQGIASFQESNWIGATFVDYVPTVPMLGLYPTVQSIAAQFALIAFAAASMIIPRGSVRAAKAAREVAGHPIRPI